MTTFHDDLANLGADTRSIADLARACGLGSDEAAGRAYHEAVPTVAQAMATAMDSPSRAEALHSLALQLSPAERTQPHTLLGAVDHPLGKVVSEQIFGAQLDSTKDAGARSAQIGNADRLLRNTGLAGLAIAAGSGPSANAFAVFVSAVTGAATGGGPAIASTPPPPPADGASPTGAMPPVGLPQSLPEPAAGGGDPLMAPPTGAAPVAMAAPVPISNGEEEDDEQPDRRVALLVAAAAILLIGGFFVIRALGDDSDSNIATTIGDPESTATAPIADVPVGTVVTTPVAADDEIAAEPIATDPPPSDPPSSDAPAVETEPDEVVDIDLAAGLEDPDVVTMSVPLRDIADPDRDASGAIELQLNTATGEICYGVNSEGISGPYASHIHAGEFGVKGGIVVELGQLESGDARCVENLPVDTNAILANPSGHYAELHDANDEWTLRGQLSERIDGDIVSLSVPMTDAKAINPDAEGVLDFDFNTVTGEICYSVSSTGVEGPYASHIHAGAVGVKGGIVVELGKLSDGDSACVDNLPVDTNAILADPAGHYAELHDVGDVWTVRGQLSNTVADVPAAGAGETGESAAEPEPESELAVDPDGDGARIELAQGTIYLRGDVADQATADDLLASLDGVGEDTPVVDELVVVADAPLPSGRIVIADAIFFGTDSSQLGEIDGPTLAAIVALAESRADSVLTVVGHTDDRGSDVVNLELSLRRATSVRDLLATLGLPDENLRIRGAGETAPIGDNDTPEGRAINRRIEFELEPAT